MRTSMTLREYIDLGYEGRAPIDEWLRAEGLMGMMIVNIEDVGEGFIDAKVWKTDATGGLVVVDHQPVPERKRFSVKRPPPLPPKRDRATDG